MAVAKKAFLIDTFINGMIIAQLKFQNFLLEAGQKIIRNIWNIYL
jgi:hypothetical protein